MADEITQSLLKRLAAKGVARGGISMTPVRAIRLAAPKAADVGHGFPLAVTQFEMEEVSLTSFIEALNENQLLLSLRHGTGAQGCATIDPGLRAALIEIQTTGRVVPGPPPNRNPTRTDAAMCDSFVNLLLETADEMIKDAKSDHRMFQFRTGGIFPNTRKLALAIEDGQVQVFRIRLDLGLGAKEGELTLMFPVTLGAPKKGHKKTPEEIAWQSGFSGAVMGGQIKLDAILHSYRLPLSELRKFTVGQIIQIPENTLSNIQLRASGQDISETARLGQMQGCRAIRINQRSDCTGVQQLDDITRPPDHSATRPSDTDEDIAGAQNNAMGVPWDSSAIVPGALSIADGPTAADTDDISENQQTNLAGRPVDLKNGPGDAGAQRDEQKTN